MYCGVIYCATNKVNGKRYVGLTSRSLEARWKQHIYTAEKQGKTYFHRAINKYGIDAFDVEPIVSALSKEYLNDLERLLIQEIKPIYNQTNGGEFTAGRKLSEETKLQIAASNRGQKRTPEQRLKNSEAKKQYYRENPEAKLAAIARIEAERNKPENIEKRIIASANSARGRVWSQESKDRLSAACIGRSNGKDVNEKIAAAKRKKILCSDGRIFSCRMTAAKETGLSPRTIWRDCATSHKATKRITFKYLDK